MIRALRSSRLYFGLFYFRLGKQGISKWCFVCLCLIEILLISRYHSSQFFIVYALYSCFTYFFNGEIQKRSRKICGEGTFPPKYMFFLRNSFSLVLGLLSNVSSGAPAYKTFQSSNTFCRNPKNWGREGLVLPNVYKIAWKFHKNEPTPPQIPASSERPVSCLNL